MSTKKKAPQAAKSAFDKMFDLLLDDSTRDQIWDVVLQAADTREQLVKLTTVPAVAADKEKLLEVWYALMDGSRTFEDTLSVADMPVFQSDPDWATSMWRQLIRQASTAEQIETLVSHPMFVEREGKDADLFSKRAGLVKTVDDVIKLVTVYPDRANRIFQLTRAWDDLSDAELFRLAAAHPEWKSYFLQRVVDRKTVELNDLMGKVALQKVAVEESKASFNENAVQVTLEMDATEEVLRQAEAALTGLKKLVVRAEKAQKDAEEAESTYRQTLLTTDALQAQLVDLGRQIGSDGTLMDMMPRVPNTILTAGLHQMSNEQLDEVIDDGIPASTSQDQNASPQVVQASHNSPATETGFTRQLARIFKKARDIANIQIPVPGA